MTSYSVSHCALISISHYLDFNLTATVQSLLDASLSNINSVQIMIKLCFAERVTRLSSHVSSSP